MKSNTHTEGAQQHAWDKAGINKSQASSGWKMSQRKAIQSRHRRETRLRDSSEVWQGWEKVVMPGYGIMVMLMES